MNLHIKDEQCPFTLDSLLEDTRLSRLFSKNNNECSIQLWILRLITDYETVMKLAYGRIVPYDFSNNSWSYSLT